NPAACIPRRVRRLRYDDHATKAEDVFSVRRTSRGSRQYRRIRRQTGTGPTGDTRVAAARSGTLSHLLYTVPFGAWRRPRNCRATRLPATALLYNRAFAAS